jgi:hypothetical protein
MVDFAQIFSAPLGTLMVFGRLTPFETLSYAQTPTLPTIIILKKNKKKFVL